MSVTCFVNYWDKLDRKQFALSGRSTTQAYYYFTQFYLLHTILKSIDGGEMYDRMFFSDFSKGFDLVDHNVLLREPDNLDVDCCLSHQQKTEGEGGGCSVPTHKVEWRNFSRK